MELDRPTIIRIALEAQLDPRTVRRAIEHGIGALQSDVDKARLRAAVSKLKCEDAFPQNTKSGKRR